MPLGSSDADYELQLCVLVKDKYYASSSQFVKVVVEPHEEDLSSFVLTDLTSPGGALGDTLQSGATQQVFQISISAMSVLDFSTSSTVRNE